MCSALLQPPSQTNFVLVLDDVSVLYGRLPDYMSNSMLSDLKWTQVKIRKTQFLSDKFRCYFWIRLFVGVPLTGVNPSMLYPRENSELMCYKLPTIPQEIFWKFGWNFVPIIILSRNWISTLKIDPIKNHAKFHQVWFSTTVVISILRSRYS